MQSVVSEALIVQALACPLDLECSLCLRILHGAWAA
jgi:hypothetical protein